GGLVLNGTATLGQSDNYGYGQLRFMGTQTLDGTGTVALGLSPDNGVQAWNNGATLTIGPNITIRGKFGQGWAGSPGSSFVNQGTIFADTAGGTIRLPGTTWSNSGTIQAANGGSLTLDGNWSTSTPLSFSGNGDLFLNGTWSYNFPLTFSGKTLALRGTWTNYGTITASNANVVIGDVMGVWSNKGTIQVNNCKTSIGYYFSSFTLADLGTFQRTGGSVYLQGILNNTGGTFTLDATTGSWNLSGGTINGGTVTETGGAMLLFTNNGGTL